MRRIEVYEIIEKFNKASSKKDRIAVLQQYSDVWLTEFSDEIDAWIIQEFKKIGLDTARSVLELDIEDLIKRTDLEEETVQEVVKILKAEFED